MNGSTHKHIVKNTAFLYIRMLLILVVTLYTSRIILEVLGEDDYGIFNLVGGVVVLFTFLGSAMTIATQRYLCSFIGQDDKVSLQKLFSSSLIAHFILILILVVIAETLGLWFVKNKLVIPPERYSASIWVYQISIVIAAVNVYRIPFNAAVLSYERMSFYAYTSIVEVGLKLIILWPLFYVNTDKLVIYAVLLLLINIILLIWYIVFVDSKLESVRHRWNVANHYFVKDIFKFAGLNALSSFANISSKQGFNILVNIFYGVAVNAAVGIMNQVSSAVYQFISNFQTAITPPLMKDYSRQDYKSVSSLLISSAKFSFLLLLILITPVIFNINEILSIWLVNVPPYTSGFCIFSLIVLLPNTIGGPVWTVMQATGKIKRYQIIISLIILFNVPVFYLLLRFLNYPPYALGIQFVTNFIVVLVGIRMGLIKLNITIRTVAKTVFLPCLSVWMLSWGIIYILDLKSLFGCNAGFWSVIGSGLIEVFIAMIISFFILTRSERKFLKSLVISKILRK